MVLVRKLILTCLRCNVNFTARHVPDRDITLADKLSRCQINDFHFRELAPCVNCEPVRVQFHISPAALWTL